MSPQDVLGFDSRMLGGNRCTHTHYSVGNVRKPHAAGRNSGGVSIFVNPEIRSKVLYLGTQPEHHICISLGKLDLLLVACYIKPNPSSGARHEAFFTHLAGIISSFEQHKRVLIVGDLNARVGVENEFTPAFDFSNVEPQFNNEILGENLEPSVGSSRKNKDIVYNQCGKSCVGFCKELVITCTDGAAGQTAQR
jgi:hypothetical protein